MDLIPNYNSKLLEKSQNGRKKANYFKKVWINIYFNFDVLEKIFKKGIRLKYTDARSMHRF